MLTIVIVGLYTNHDNIKDWRQIAKMYFLELKAAPLHVYFSWYDQLEIQRIHEMVRYLITASSELSPSQEPSSSMSGNPFLVVFRNVGALQ